MRSRAARSTVKLDIIFDRLGNQLLAALRVFPRAAGFRRDTLAAVAGAALA
jgi:hypothetical protein